MNRINCMGVKALVLGIIACLCLMGQVAWGDYVFGEPTPLPDPINSTWNETSVSMSADGLELYYPSQIKHLWVATRDSTADDWSTAIHTKLESTTDSFILGDYPRISADGLELYFSRYMPAKIYRVRRQSSNDPWGPAEKMEILNSNGWDHVRCLSADGLVIYYNGMVNYSADDLHMATRETKDSDWVPSEDSVLTFREWGVSLTPSELHLIVSTMPLPGNLGEQDLGLVTRATTNAEWSDPLNLGSPMSSLASDCGPWFAYDGSVIFFTSNRPGGMGEFDIWQAPILPVFDFNGDGNVDSLDAAMLIENWGTGNSLYDIGPTFFGDGIVDAKDLRALADYMIAHPYDPGQPIGAEAITATASSSDSDNTGPEKTIDGSGLSEHGQHSTNSKDMWLSGGTEPQWIQYEFNKVYELREMHIWNHNQVVEPFVGVGTKDVLIETSLDEVEWTTLEGVSQFNQATGSADYMSNTIVDFGDIVARFVRITILSGYGMWSQRGLSEVRFYVQ